MLLVFNEFSLSHGHKILWSIRNGDSILGLLLEPKTLASNNFCSSLDQSELMDWN